MNGPRGTALLVVLLLISGYLGFIARALTGVPLFGLMGLVGFLFAAAIGVGALIGQFREGFAEPKNPGGASSQNSSQQRNRKDAGPAEQPTESYRDRFYRGP